MKILFRAIWLLLIAVSAHASFVTNNWNAPGAAPSSVTNTVKITFVNTNTPFALTNGTIIYSFQVTTNIVNGVLGPVFLQPGGYSVTVGPQSDYLSIQVPNDTNTYSLYSLTTNMSAVTNFSTLPGVAAIVAGTNITVQQAGSAWVINSSGGGSAVAVSNISGSSTGLSAVTNGGVVTVVATNINTASFLSNSGSSGTNIFLTNSTITNGNIGATNVAITGGYLTNVVADGNGAGLTNVPSSSTTSSNGAVTYTTSVNSAGQTNWDLNGVAGAALSGSASLSNLTVTANETVQSNISAATENISGLIMAGSEQVGTYLNVAGTASASQYQSTNSPGYKTGTSVSLMSPAGSTTNDGGILTNIQLAALPSAVVTNQATNITLGIGTNTTTREISVKAFGAIGNGVVLNNTTGAAGSLYATNASASFTSSDVGKYIHWRFCGTNGADLFSAISNVASSTVVGLSNAVLTAPAVGGNTFTYGNDDTISVSNGIYFCCLNHYTLIFPMGIYCLANTNYDLGQWTNHHNAQLVLPAMPYYTTMYAPTFLMKGVPGTTDLQSSSVLQSNMLSFYGSVLYEMLPDGAGGAMLSCANFTSSCYQFTSSNQRLGTGGTSAPFYTNTYNYNGVRLAMQDLTWVLPSNPNMIGLDLRNATSYALENVNVITGDADYCGVQPTYTNSACIVTPGPNCGGFGITKHCDVSGAYWGWILGEQSKVDNVLCLNCYKAVGAWDGFFHICGLNNFVITGCRYGFVNEQTGYAPFFDFYTCENNNAIGAGWWYPMQSIMQNEAFNGTVTGQLIGRSSTGTDPLPVVNASFLDHSYLCYNGAITNLYINTGNINSTGVITGNQILVNPGNFGGVIITQNNYGDPAQVRLATPGVGGSTWELGGGQDGFDSYADAFYVRISSGAIPFMINNTASQIQFNSWPIAGNGLLLTNTFAPVNHPATLPINASGVTNTSTNFCTAVVTATSTTWWITNSFGLPCATNTTWTGAGVPFPLAPGDVIHAASGLSGYCYFP